MNPRGFQRQDGRADWLTVSCKVTLTVTNIAKNILKQYMQANHIKTFVFKSQCYCHVYWNRRSSFGSCSLYLIFHYYLRCGGSIFLHDFCAWVWFLLAAGIAFPFSAGGKITLFWLSRCRVWGTMNYLDVAFRVVLHFWIL